MAVGLQVSGNVLNSFLNANHFLSKYTVEEFEEFFNVILLVQFVTSDDQITLFVIATVCEPQHYSV